MKFELTKLITSRSLLSRRPASLPIVALLAIGLLFATLLTACAASDQEVSPDQQPSEEIAMGIQLSSSAFSEGSVIPKQYTCDGEDISPPLTWTDLPENTTSLALIMDDPDAPAGTWVHWVLYDLPGDVEELQENTELAAGSGKLGKNSWGRLAYGGPCPPSGSHRYFFKLYALDTFLELDEGVAKDELLQAMEGHILDRGQLMGTYARS